MLSRSQRGVSKGAARRATDLGGACEPAVKFIDKALGAIELRVIGMRFGRIIESFVQKEQGFL